MFPKYYPELTIDDTVLAAEPETTGPFKVYGEDSATGTRGWFYPVYTTKSAAGTGAASKSYTFTGMNKLFYIPVAGATLRLVLMILKLLNIQSALRLLEATTAVMLRLTKTLEMNYC